MTDWDFSESETMNEAIGIVENRQGRSVSLSMATGVTKFNRNQCGVVDPHRLLRAPLSHVAKAIKCAQEQAIEGCILHLSQFQENGARETRQLKS